MRILLTGQPRSGKSVLMQKLVSAVGAKQGFLTKEVVRNGQRTGFVMVDPAGREGVLAQTSTPTPYVVSRYFVEVDSLDEFLRPLSQFAPGDLLYIDEIGQMQLHSLDFKGLVERYLTAPNDFIGTVTSVYSDEFTQDILGRSDILVCALSAENRADIGRGLAAAITNRHTFNKLPKDRQLAAMRHAREYIAAGQYESFYKLFNNAIVYVSENRVHKIRGGSYRVRGNTDSHEVVLGGDGSWQCDCPLFNGKYPYQAPAECSHCQAVKLVLEDGSLEN